MKVGILFPGYTSQFVGMGKEFYDQSRLMQEYFEEASNCLSINFVKLCFASSDIELSKGLHANASLFLVGASISKIMQEQGITPTIVGGTGVGQFTALFASGGINIPDGLYLLGKYSHFFEELHQTTQHKLLLLHNIPLKTVQQLCSDHEAIITSFISSHDHAICLPESKVANFTHDAKALKAKVQKLAPDFGFYCQLSESISTHLTRYLEKVDCNNLAIPVLNTQTAKIITKSSQVKTLISQFAHSPLKWHQSLKKLSDCDIIVEIAPTGLIKQQVQALYPDKMVHSISKPEDIESLLSLITTQQSPLEQVELLTELSI